MKSFFKVLLAPLFWILQGCNPLGGPFDAKLSNNHYYNSSKTDVIYSPMGNWFELGKTEMQVDIESFELLNSLFGKDKERVYFESYALEHPEVDVASFDANQEVYMTNFGLDKKNVYVLNTDYQNGQGFAKVTVIEDADPLSYVQHGFDWGKDANSHFYRHKKINVDYNSFKNLNDYFSTDKNAVYLHYGGNFEEIEADGHSFVLLENSDYAHDKETLYHPSFDGMDSNKIALLRIPHQDQKIEQYNSNYLACGDSLYFRGRLLKKGIRESFEIVSDRYAKDGETVFFEEKPITGSDVETFQISDDGLTVYDKHGNYREGELIAKID